MSQFIKPVQSCRNLWLALTLSCVFGSSSLFATDLIFPGIQPKDGAGAGQTISRGPSALFYNPANLIFSKKIEPYADISFVSITYAYAHTDTTTYAPAVVKVAGPPVTAGFGLRLWPRLAIGVVFVPKSAGKSQVVEDVPLRVLGQYTPVKIENTQEGTRIAAGAAFRFGFPLTLGLGLIHSSEKNALVITAAGADHPFIDLQDVGAWNQFLVGVRSELFDRKVVLALSYKTAVQKQYQGEVLVAIDPKSDYTAFEGTGYIPAAIGFGAETRFGMLGVFVDYVRELWSAGRQLTKRGFIGDPEATDLVDTDNIAAGIKIWPLQKHMLTAAISLQGANVGNGTEVTQGDATATPAAGASGEERLSGVTFGSLEAIPRTIVAGGYRYKLTGHGYLQVGAQYTTGKREVPAGFDAEGTYSLSMIMGSVGLAFGF